MLGVGRAFVNECDLCLANKRASNMAGTATLHVMLLLKKALLSTAIKLNKWRNDK